jgi:hypothetical protein
MKKKDSGDWRGGTYWIIWSTVDFPLLLRDRGESGVVKAVKNSSFPRYRSRLCGIVQLHTPLTVHRSLVKQVLNARDRSGLVSGQIPLIRGSSLHGSIQVAASRSVPGTLLEAKPPAHESDCSPLRLHNNANYAQQRSTGRRCHKIGPHRNGCC